MRSSGSVYFSPGFPLMKPPTSPPAMTMPQRPRARACDMEMFKKSQVPELSPVHKPAKRLMPEKLPRPMMKLRLPSRSGDLFQPSKVALCRLKAYKDQISIAGCLVFGSSGEVRRRRQGKLQIVSTCRRGNWSSSGRTISCRHIPWI